MIIQVLKILFNEFLEKFDGRVVKLLFENDIKYEMIMGKLDIKIVENIYNIMMLMLMLENDIKINILNIW